MRIVLFVCVLIVLVGCEPKNDNIAFTHFNNLENSEIPLPYIFEKESFSGKYSALLNNKNPFGLEFVDAFPEIGNQYIISVKRKSKNNIGLLVVSGEDSENLYEKYEFPAKKLENGWELLYAKITIPPNYKKEPFKVYCYNPFPDSVFFDDLKVIKYHKLEVPPPVENVQNLTLQIPQSSLDSLKKYRTHALNQISIPKSSKKWVKATIVDKENIPVKIRLKGDWLDHLKSDKYSLRIKIKGGKKWNEMSVFSIQSPDTKGLVDEWFFHKLLHSLDILSPKYTFCSVSINGKNMGYYAVEENFTTEILERNNKPVGPILKISENIMWDHLNNKNLNKHIYKDAKLKCYNKKEIKDSIILSKSFDALKSVQFATENKFAYINKEKYALYYAINDLIATHHSARWHNQRFYFNPNTHKLEPIAFDGNTSEHYNEALKNPKPWLPSINDSVLFYRYEDDYAFKSFFNDTSFLNLYYQSTKKITEKYFYDSQIKPLMREAKDWQKILNDEFPYYQFDTAYYEKQTQLLKSAVSKIQRLPKSTTLDRRYLLQEN